MLALLDTAVLVAAHVAIEDPAKKLLNIREELDGLVHVLELQVIVQRAGAFQAAQISFPNLPGGKLFFAQVIHVLEVALHEVLEAYFEAAFGLHLLFFF